MTTGENDSYEKCTIVIPTFNRPYYLRRLLSYYDKYGQRFNIIVADSSSGENMEINKKIISLFSNLKILHLCNYSPEIHLFHKILKALDYAKDKYLVLCADDDFITPTGLNKAVLFLEKNADFTVAYGRSLRFWPRSISGNRQQFVCNIESMFLSITCGEPDKRLTHYMSNYSSTFYGVQRKNFLKLIFKEGANFTDDQCFAEVLMSVLTLIYGKTKCLDVFYVAREAVPGSAATKIRKMGDSIKDGTYSEKYAKFRDCLSKHLYEKSQLSSIEESRKVIDGAMSVYLSTYIRIRQPIKNILTRKTKNSLENTKLPGWIYEWVRSIYRSLFLSGQLRMDNSEDFANTPYSKDYREINNIYRHVKEGV